MSNLAVPLWFLFLDTNSSVLELNPPSDLAQSTRLTRDHEPLPIWPYVGFHQIIAADRRANRVINTPREALLISHLKRYGRPVRRVSVCPCAVEGP